MLLRLQIHAYHAQVKSVCRCDAFIGVFCNAVMHATKTSSYSIALYLSKTHESELQLDWSTNRLHIHTAKSLTCLLA